MNRYYVRSVCAIAIWSLLAGPLVGCVAGNFGLTRKVAHWNNSFSLLPRILLYIGLLIIPVYELSMLFYFLINNTIQFWDGSALVTSQNQTFEKDGKKVVVV